MNLERVNRVMVPVAVAMVGFGLVLRFGIETVARWGYLAVLILVLAAMALAGRKWGRDE